MQQSKVKQGFSTTRRLYKSSSAVSGSDFAMHDEFRELSFDNIPAPDGSDRKFSGGLRTQGYSKQDTAQHPLVSIVTVLYNGAAHLTDAMLSVLNQPYDNVEYIIIDGGSSDGSLAIIKQYEHAIDYWISEADDGIYDAMNKGIKLAKGRIVGLLNSDDILSADCIQKIVTSFQENPTAEYTVGSVELINERGVIYGKSSPFPKEQRHRRRFLEMPAPHLSMFVLRSTYERFGFFDTSFELRSDYDFVLRLMASDIPDIELPFSVGSFRSGGKSGGMATWLETRAVLRKNGAAWWQAEYAFLRSVIKSNLGTMFPKVIIEHLKRFTLSKNEYY